jgi:DNA invertase Pin-like site-specific DNA recombinase
MRVAYPYLRYSDSKQAKGDSARRQSSWHEETAKREGWTLDYSLKLEDKGRSAYHGDHLKYDLGRFLAHVNDGTVKSGSVLLFEELDRLSRQDLGKAFPLFTSILMSGVDIRTRERHYTEADLSDLGTVIGVIVKQSTANEESRKKSIRVGANWAAWRQRVAAGERVPPPGRMPPWIRWTGTAFALVPAAAEAVRLIFRLAASGLGLRRLLARLNGKDGKDGSKPVPTIGRCPTWRLSYVAKLLNFRAVLGEAVDASGQVYADFWPAVVSEQEFYAVREAMTGRRIGGKGAKGTTGQHHVGRNGVGVPNLFVGLLRDARDGSRLHVIDKGAGQGGGKYLIGSGAERRERDSVRAAFPLSSFEQAVLALLREIDPAEVLGKKKDGVDEVAVLKGEKDNLEASIALLARELDRRGESAVLFGRLEKKETRLAEVTAQLDKAQARAAHPLDACWRDCKTLLDALDKAPDREAARLRLRAALARVVEEVWCLFVNRGKGVMLAALQCRFSGGGQRDYLVMHRASFASGKSRKTPRWWAKSLAGVAAIGPLDLRKQKDAKELEAALDFYAAAE